jgi:hypothetical protein
VVRIGVAASPWACVGCAVELVLRIAPGSFLFWWRGLWRARARAPAAQPPPPPSAPLGVGVGPAHPAPGSALVLSLAELFIFLPDLGLALRRHAARVYLKAVKTPCPRFAVRGPPAYYGSPGFWLLPKPKPKRGLTPGRTSPWHVRMSGELHRKLWLRC